MGEEPKQKESAGLDEEVRFCPFCGDNWDEADKTNQKILCSCNRIFKVIYYGKK